MKHENINHSSVLGYGYAVRGLPINWVPTVAVTTVETIAANGGSVAVPIFLPSKMLLQDAAVRNTDTTSARTWQWDLYRDDNTSNSATRVATGTAAETFTASAASNRIIVAASAPVSLPPGAYWLVIQNQHATNTFGLGYTDAGIFGPTVCQVKTTTNPNGASLDFVAATWNKNSRIYGVTLRGRAFAQSSAF